MRWKMSHVDVGEERSRSELEPFHRLKIGNYIGANVEESTGGR